MRRQNRRERRKRFADNVVDVVQLIRRNDIWRYGIEHIAERAEQDAVLEKERIEARSEIRERSEEHTSELQSQSNLVCRLLLEKKKTNNNHGNHGQHFT